MSKPANRALALYRAPFKHECGYIWDARGEMVADGKDDRPATPATVRVRGWGRIGYEKDAEALFDEVGEEIAAALTEHWRRNQATPTLAARLDEAVALLRELHASLHHHAYCSCLARTFLATIDAQGAESAGGTRPCSP